MDRWRNKTRNRLKHQCQTVDGIPSTLSCVTAESLAALVEVQEIEEVDGLGDEIIETPIEDLDLSVRVFNSLKRAGIVAQQTTRVYVFASGEVSKEVKLKCVGVTKGARDEIEKDGGAREE